MSASRWIGTETAVP